MQHILDAATKPTRRLSLQRFAALDYLCLGLVALALRLIDLGHFVTLDEANFWIQRSELFLTALRAGDWAATAIAPHPGVTTMWLGSAGLLLSSLLDSLGQASTSTFVHDLRLLQLPVALFHLAGILIGYALLRRMLPVGTAFLAAMLWAADPFVVGFSRVLHVDALAGTGMTVALLAAIVYWRHEPRLVWLLLSGVSAAIAALSKSPGLIVIPVIVAVALTDHHQDRARLGERLAPLCVWVCAGLVTALALWPALWADPIEVYQLVRFGVEGDGASAHALGNFFLGREDLAPGVLFYPVALALRLTPITLVGVLLLPLAVIRAGPLPRQHITTLVSLVVLFITAVTLFPKKFNRYLVPIFPLLDILAAIAIVAALMLLTKWLARACRRSRSTSRRTAPGLLAGIAALAVINAWFWHPYGIVAFNQLLGGAPVGANSFVAGWGEGMEQVADWLNQQPDITGVIVASTQTAPLRPYLIPGAQVMTPQRALPEQTGYVVIYHRDIQPRPLPPFDQFYGRSTPQHIVRLHGVEYAWIYTVPPHVPQPLSAQFGDALVLRGYEVAGSVQAGEELRLRLFWHTIAPPVTDYAIFAHLVDREGNRYAQSDPIFPTTLWGDDRYMTTELRLIASQPRGDRAHLIIGVYDPHTGDRLPLASEHSAERKQAGPDALLLTTLPSAAVQQRRSMRTPE